MTRREITAGTEWASRDAARAEAMRAERVEQDPVAQAELDRIQWEGQPTPWFADYGGRKSTVISTPAVADFRLFTNPTEGESKP